MIHAYPVPAHRCIHSPLAPAGLSLPGLRCSPRHPGSEYDYAYLEVLISFLKTIAFL